MRKTDAGRRRGLSSAELEPEVLRVLTEARGKGLTKAEIVAAIRTTSAVSVQRALVRLRDHDAPIECTGTDRRWRLVAPFAMPLETPEADDVVAVLLARAILAPFADADLVARVDRIAEQLDERLRDRTGPGNLPTAAVSATLTLGTIVEPGVLRALLAACRRKAVRIGYASPWRAADSAQRNYEIEPWALRVHDGAAYLRAWRRDVAAARTFRVAHIDRIEDLTLAANEALARVPSAARLWGDDDPAFGIDRDRPGIAVVVLYGSVARWVSRVRWHPGQKDRWIEPGEVLERRLAFRSCRELARRIASVYDGVRTIEPESLRDAVHAIVVATPPAELPGVLHRVSADRVADGSSRAADDEQKD